MFKTILKILAVCFIIIVLLTIFFSLYLNKVPIVQSTFEIEIPSSLSSKKICDLLEEKKVIPYKIILYYIIKFTNSARKIKAGEYVFHKGDTYISIWKKLLKGSIIPVKVTIPEGSDIYDIAKILENKKIIESKVEFEEFCFNQDKIKYFLNNGFSMEGYLFPDTYKFNKKESIKNIVKKLNNNFKKKVLPLFNNITLNLTLNEAIILASIIQKETYFKKEMPIIASVFFNRLKRGMKLQSDPTVLYGIRHKNKKFLTYKDLKIYSPYNTYMNYGLPPTPICNPGIYAILAVLNPAKTDYLYFVSSGKGYHIFSKTFKEHLKNKRKYKQLK